MRHSLILTIAVTAFIAVEFASVQTSDAQRLRRLFQRNNDCSNGCCNCGTSSGSSEFVSEGPIVTSGDIGSSQIISDGSYVESAPVVFESPVHSQGEIISSGTETGFPTEGIAVKSIGPDEFSGNYPSEFQNANYPVEQSYSIEPVGCASCNGGINVIPASTTSSQGQIIDADYTDNGYAEGGIINENSVMGEVMGCTSGDCGGQIIQSEVTGCTSGDCGGQIIQSEVTGCTSGDCGGQIIQSEVTGCTSGDCGGQVIQGEVTGCTSGDCGGQVIQGEVTGCTSGDCGGQIIQGEVTGCTNGDCGGQVIQGDFEGQITSSGSSSSSEVLYDRQQQQITEDGSHEQVISSEIISETPIESTGEVSSDIEVSSPSASIADEEAAATETPAADDAGDKVPDAPAKEAGDNKEA